MLEITSIDKGIVIDHIKAGFGFKVYNYLNLDKAEYNVALITNAYSEKMGKKDIIKINNVIDIDYTFLGLIDPNITVNIIDNGKTVKKVKLEVPQVVRNIIKCKNPRCVTSVEHYFDHVFHLVDKDKRSYRCEYCDDIVIPYPAK
ncbi:MAG: aspartate carbamoyltransferase regulatory subunit [Bacteroidales bacterium]|jgi:aspartate carbamoyltransferase regulatory subunit|nr:aspartate carbamoyltransferase regulatory subunit [Bacteroidota bacterium]MBQ9508750.1 aspartate carbamoyltransferase regulatory subunit [Bacteroidales bacterium]MBR6062811.1 aspartate carbamoyltransferase regulatory subunit [Bacteroidales bacterium]